MEREPPNPPSSGVATPGHTSEAHGFYRRGGRSGKPRRPEPDKWDDLNDDAPNRLEDTDEQGDKTRSPKSRLSDPSDDLTKESKGGTALMDVLYSITCRDIKGKRFQIYVTPENPFEEFISQDLENSKMPMIIRVRIEANGTGSPSDWIAAPYMPKPFVRDVYDDDMNIDISRAGRRRFSPSPPPPRRVIDYSDFNSEASNENDEDFLDEEQFEGPTRSRTFRAGDRAPLSLEEVLNKEIFRASVVTWKEIHILSKNLMNLLRIVVQRYPGQSLKGEQIVVKAPFEMLAHYYNDLNALQSGSLDVLARVSHERADDAEQLEMPDKNDLLDQATIYDLNVLLRAFKWHYIKNFAVEEARYNVGFTSYELLWFLFKPGVDVYARIGGKISGFVFEQCEKRGQREERDRYDGPRGGSSYYVVHCWSLTYNGQRIVKTSHEFFIDKFRGERQITSLPVFPSVYLDSEDGGKTRARLQDLGEKYYNIMRQSPAHREYCGMAWDLERHDERDDTAQRWQKWKPDIEHTGEIVVDHRRGRNSTRARRRSPSYEYPRRPLRAGSPPSSAEEDSDSGDDVQSEPAVPRKIKAPNFKKINPKDQESLTPHHYFLLPRRMNGYALARKQRMGFDVENIQPITWPSRESDPMSTLILDDSDKDVVKALARKYSRGQGTWGADFVEGKGEGQIFLLHGPPGTGKTYTVECVAKYTRRPLLRLTVADIGTDERQMEDILGEWFQRGADWGAIILIDEADVFLEKRQVKDLQRNSLVSVFLSCMEYYTGMLFLTTNRIGQIDDAFLSRTSVALTYKTLDTGKQRHIWQGFLKKLSEERKDIALTDRAKKFLENLDKDETTKDVPWNGREIRNALQTAIALASFDAEEEAEESGVKPGKILVRDTHFQTVVDRRKEFIAYRKSIRNQDEEARAFSEGSRAPPPVVKKG